MSQTDKKKRSKFPEILGIILLLTCLGTLVLGILLKRGVSFDSFTISRFAISEFSLIWQKKLVLEVGEIVILEQGATDKGIPERQTVEKGIKIFHYLANFFSRVTVNRIKVVDLTGTIHLSDSVDPEASYFIAKSPDLEIRANLVFTDDSLAIDITKAKSARINTEATGRFLFDAQKVSLTGSLTADITGSFPVTVDVVADSNQLSFKGKRAGKIETITPFAELFGLSRNIQRWITDYLQGNSYDLKTFSGVIPWSNPGAILDSLYAEVRVMGCQYTFAPGLEPLKSDYTDVVFAKGVLTIQPSGATFYGQKAEGSWLDISFNDIANILLTAHIHTRAMANQDIIGLLSYYKIPLPFKQIAGGTNTSLVLSIVLNKIKITAKGTILIDDGVLEYQGKKYDVKEAKIIFVNSDITIEKGNVRFANYFEADVSGEIQAKSGTGDLEIVLQQSFNEFGDSVLQLNTLKSKPKIQYHIRPDGHSLDVSTSFWEMNSRQFKLGSFRTPFSPENLSAVFPPVLLESATGTVAEISGDFSVKEKRATVKCLLLRYDLKDFSLESPELPLLVQYDGKLIIKIEKISHWRLHNIPITLFPNTLGFTGKIISITDGRLSYGDFFDSELDGQYDFQKLTGEFLLKNMHVKEKNIGDLLGINNSVTIKISGEKEGLVVSVPEINLEIRADKDKKWSAAITDLSAIHDRVPLLQRFKVDTGSLTVSLGQGEKSYNFAADITYQFPLLIKDNIPTDHYVLTGNYSEKGLHVTINDDMQVEYLNALSVSSKNLGYNIPAITDLIRNIGVTDTDSPAGESIVSASVEATNSSLFFKKGSEVLADKIHLDSVEGKTAIRLVHGSGTIDAEIDGTTFSVEGKDLNDIFMSSLSSGANFEKGKMNLAMSGTSDHFSVLISIKNTLLKNFTTFNNIMAFLDTIPSLITFSKPEYNLKGLPVTSALIGMEIADGVAEFKNLEVISPALTMAGSGRIDFTENVITVYLNLITGAKASLSKIPLVGYVATDKKKKPSLTVKISGDLNDPKVESSVLRKIVTWPFSVVYRTLRLPLHLFESMGESTEDENLENTSETGDVSK